jgi:hypothetical protein
MSIYMPEERQRELIKPGAHLAVCCSVIDLGTQQTEYGSKRQVYIGFELPDELRSDGKIFNIGKFYTLSSDERATLRRDIEGWLGRPLTRVELGSLDISSHLGLPATLVIQHKTSKAGRVGAVIASITRPPKSAPPRMGLTTPGLTLSLNTRPFDQFTFQQLPSWLQQKITASPEYAAAVGAHATAPIYMADRLHQSLGAPGVLAAMTAMAAAAAPAAVSVVDDLGLDDEIPL